MKKSLFLIAFAFILCDSVAQDNVFTFTGYTDCYYTTDNDKNSDDKYGNHPVRKYASINNMKDRFGLNIAYIALAAKSENYRSKVGLQYGSIPDNVYYEEPKYLQQANIGVRLVDKLWFDAGFFTTHIGGEATHPRYNFITSHSMATFYEPTYHSGAKLSYDFSNGLTAEVSVLSGSHLYRDNNENKSFGWNLCYTTSDGNYSVFYAGIAGNEEPSGTKGKTHILHNISGYARPIEKLELKAQLDYATMEKSVAKGNNFETGVFYGAFVQARYHISEKLKVSARFTKFDDSENIYKTNIAGMDLSGAIEYNPTNNSYMRFESRHLDLSDSKGKLGEVFYEGEEYGNTRTEFSLNFGLFFDVNTKF